KEQKEKERQEKERKALLLKEEREIQRRKKKEARSKAKEAKKLAELELKGKISELNANIPEEEKPANVKKEIRYIVNTIHENEEKVSVTVWEIWFQREVWNSTTTHPDRIKARAVKYYGRSITKIK